eukprot:9634753-Heterocapsa_arctica.AAC.1
MRRATRTIIRNRRRDGRRRRISRTKAAEGDMTLKVAAYVVEAQRRPRVVVGMTATAPRHEYAKHRGAR